MTLENRTAIITGATGGLGRVVARAFGEQGANLVLLGRTQESLDQLAEDLGVPEERVLPLVADVGNPGGIAAAKEAALKKFAQAHILLNLVGGWVGGKPVAEVSEAEITDMLGQHLWTNFHLMQAFAPHFVDNGWGRYIIVSSPNAARPPGRNAPYAVGKISAEALVISLAEEARHTGVTANILLVRQIDASHERGSGPGAKGADWTQPEEIAAAMLYLCSEEGGRVSGARIPLYGQM
jgi:NAD(P)-dependent dehydrogenase (short-subunit alcohol dehydrogenase family)